MEENEFKKGLKDGRKWMNKWCYYGLNIIELSILWKLWKVIRYFNNDFVEVIFFFLVEFFLFFSEFWLNVIDGLSV